MLVDSHCHLQDPKFKADVDGVIARAVDAGVTAMVVIGYDMASSRRGIEIADSYENIFAAIGVHPHDAKTLRPKDIDELAKMADSAKVVAIGEIGYDFYRNLSPREDQERAFRAQLDLARLLRLPVVIHARDADEETYQMLAEYEAQARPDWPKHVLSAATAAVEGDRPLGVMHCYAGDLPLALRYIELGFVVSIAGTVTYPNADLLRAVAGGIPLRWMAVETDAPYLSPQSMRGKRNEPAYVLETAKFIAELRGDKLAEVCDKTATTTAWLFGLGDIGEPVSVQENAR